MAAGNLGRNITRIDEGMDKEYLHSGDQEKLMWKQITKDEAEPKAKKKGASSQDHQQRLASKFAPFLPNLAPFSGYFFCPISWP